MIRQPNDASQPLDRRLLIHAAGLAAALGPALLSAGAAAAEPGEPGSRAGSQVGPATAAPQPPAKVAMLVHPKMVLLDLVGPLTVFNLMRCQIHLCWKNRDLLQTDVPVGISANTTFGECPSDLDVLFVPGGLEGSVMMMDDPEVIEFLQDRARTARYVTSVCTGGLVLGAAGLLKGVSGDSHWYVRDLLSMMGAVPVHERVVQDRNRITAGGVTAGIDFGLAISIAMRGSKRPSTHRLALEYDPHPPLDAGSPEKAGPGPTAHILQVRGPAIEAARQKAVAIGARL